MYVYRLTWRNLLGFFYLLENLSVHSPSLRGHPLWMPFLFRATRKWYNLSEIHKKFKHFLLKMNFKTELNYKKIFPQIYHSHVVTSPIDLTISVARSTSDLKLVFPKGQLIPFFQLNVCISFTSGRDGTLARRELLLKEPCASDVISMDMGINWKSNKMLLQRTLWTRNSEK